MPRQSLGTEREVAEYLNVRPRTLQQYRWLGIGPRWVRIGGQARGNVRYRWQDVDAYVNSQVKEAS